VSLSVLRPARPARDQAQPKPAYAEAG
jgi:hypothetical protein